MQPNRPTLTTIFLEILGRHKIHRITEFTEAINSDDTDGITKHRLTPITPTLKHDNTQ